MTRARQVMLLPVGAPRRSTARQQAITNHMREMTPACCCCLLLPVGASRRSTAGQQAITDHMRKSTDFRQSFGGDYGVGGPGGTRRSMRTTNQGLEELMASYDQAPGTPKQQR